MKAEVLHAEMNVTKVKEEKDEEEEKQRRMRIEGVRV